MPDPKPDPSNPAAAAAQALSKAARPAEGEAQDTVAIPATAEQVQLRRYEFRLAESMNNSWMGIAPRGTTPEDFNAQPQVGALIGDDLNRFDIVRLVASDGAWWGEYLCVDAGRGFADLRLLRSTKLPPRQTDPESRIPAGHQIRQGLPGEQPGWLVVRLKDGLVMNLGTHLHQKEAALRFCIDHASNRHQDVGNLRR